MILEMRKFLVLAIISMSYISNCYAEIIELFSPFTGATAYEVKIHSPQTKKNYNYLLEKPEIETNDIEAGNYIMQARYKNSRDQWSPWTNDANLKIRKSITKKTVVFGNKVITTERIPYSLSIGTASLNSSIIGKGEDFNSTESLIKIKGTIEKNVFKYVLNYDSSAKLNRIDFSFLKMLNPNAAVGINFWMMNFNADRVIANYSQGFAEGNYIYPFYDRWNVFVRAGVGLSFNYYVRPEVTYTLPIGKEMFLGGSLTYEKSKVDQSGFLFEANGPGVLITFSHFVDM